MASLILKCHPIKRIYKTSNIVKSKRQQVLCRIYHRSLQKTYNSPHARGFEDIDITTTTLGNDTDVKSKYH